MKSSIIKKVDGLVKDSNDYREKQEFPRAISKIKQALDFVKLKAKDSEEREEKIKNLIQTLDQIYTEHINQIAQINIEIVSKNDFELALANLEEALSICYKIKDLDLQTIEKNKINKLIEEIGIRKTLNTGKSLVQSEQYEKASEIYKLALNEALKLYEYEENELVAKIKAESDEVNQKFIMAKIQEINSILNQGKRETALERLESLLKQCERFHDLALKDDKITQIEKEIDEIYSIDIAELIEKAKIRTQDKEYDKATEMLGKAMKISKSIYNSEIKQKESQKLIDFYDETIKPVYEEKINPLIEKGKSLRESDDFQSSRTMFDEAVINFTEALKIAKKMIDYDKKEQIISQITDLLDTTCKESIKPHTDESLRYANEKAYDKAISELYSALSIAKSMACEDEDNEEIDNIKDMINKVYVKEIEDIKLEAKNLLENKKFEEAIEKYNEGLSATNKMYLSDEMEREVSRIKELIYEVELKQIVDKGEVFHQETQYDKEIAKLKESLDFAKRIEDPKLKELEIHKIKTSIDQVHSSEIKLYLEQSSAKIEQKQEEEAYNLILKASNVVDLIESPLISHQEKEKVINALFNLTTILFGEKKYKESIEISLKLINIDEDFVEAYYLTGVNFLYLGEYEKAVEFFQKTVNLDSTKAKAWNYLGFSYQKLDDYKLAIESYSKTLEINPKFSMALFNMANTYFKNAEYLKSVKNYERVIEIEPNFAEAWFFMGSAYLFNNNYEAGINYLEKAIELKKELGKEVTSLLKQLTDVKLSIEKALKKKFADYSDIL